MLFPMSVIYGMHIILVTYLIAYLAVRGCLGSGAMPFYLVTLKYIIYWKIMSFGFKNLDSSGIVIGMVSAIYLSLPLMYWINKVVVRRSEKENSLTNDRSS